MRPLTHGSLFAGIGGFDLGFERAGFKTIWQVEIDPYCRKVLEKNFPHAKRFDDIHDVVRWHHLDWVDVISGGFPCQDISNAGKRTGIDGERSGLWSEMWRVIRAMAPRFVIVENVSALLGRGMERVLGDLASGGYDAEWDVLPASAFGAPHIRERVFIVAYPPSDLRRASWDDRSQSSDRSNSLLAYANSERRDRQTAFGCESWPRQIVSGSSPDVAYPERFPGQVRTTERERLGRLTGSGHGADAIGTRLAERQGLEGNHGTQCAAIERSDWWAVEPDVGRVAHGVPSRVDRLKGLGNAVVPQIAEWIARRIKAAEDATRA